MQEPSTPSVLPALWWFFMPGTGVTSALTNLATGFIGLFTLVIDADMVDAIARTTDNCCRNLPLHRDLRMMDEKTLQTYAAKAATYADLVCASVAKDPMFQLFLEALPPHSDVLDLGCGPGHFSAEIAANGHRVTATDAVQEMVDLAATHTDVTAHLASFDDIAGTALYDGIWANFSLLHAPRDAMPTHLAALHTALKPDGLFHIALKSGEGSKRDSLGRLYTYYTEGELSGLLMEAGFSVTARHRGADKGLDGVVADWIALAAHG
jgi:SAM-dependent methyltransferase